MCDKNNVGLLFDTAHAHISVFNNKDDFNNFDDYYKLTSNIIQIHLSRISFKENEAYDAHFYLQKNKFQN